MRCRVHKRKVLLLMLLFAAIAVATWSVLRERSLHSYQDPSFLFTNLAGKVKASGSRLARNISRANNSAEELKHFVYTANLAQTLYNEKRFPQRPNDGVIVVVATGSSPELLRITIESLHSARGISDVLLVLSHDRVSAELDTLARSVDFCQLIRIYFPFSLQLYPNDFPGPDPAGCPRDATHEDAQKMRCINAQFPDRHGHYREAAFTQAKHHWWWTLNFVWSRLRANTGNNGLVLFLDEAQAVLPDFLPTLHLMRVVQSGVAAPDVFCLGIRESSTNGPGPASALFAGAADAADTASWQSSRHAAGLAITRHAYELLRSCTQEFCSYDDYNWDWSFQQVSATCLAHPLIVMVLRAPRVLHSADCGAPAGEVCNAARARERLEAVSSGASRYLFPDTVRVVQVHYPIAVHPPAVNGGWADPRDHELCRRMPDLH
uniref:alpha-1,6-mannosyl-glycoprotein 2-beta-N-acetylglucosaminyltransferase-like n=1 Tax=Myxine glutinosa TaxID=7769 RepID=UPI00358FF6C2